MHRVRCITESVYSGALTRGATYEVVAMDDREHQLRLRNDRGRTRWYPADCFADPSVSVARLVTFTLDDSIADPVVDGIEVSLTLADGRRRWCIFTTPAHVAQLGHALEADGQPFHAFFDAPHVIIVTRVAEDVVATTLDYLDRQGRLEACTLELDASAG